MEHEGEGRERPEEAGRAPAASQRRGSHHRFLDLEMSKVLLEQACRASQEAFRQLLVDRVKARLDARLGDRLDALADIAVDDLVADLEANLEIERRIEARAESKEASFARLREVLAE